VFIPGSPVMTLPELLVRAEEGLEKGSKSVGAAAVYKTPSKGLGGQYEYHHHRDPFKTPAPRGSSSISFEAHEGDEATSATSATREWTKDDWKQLDACFTDERLDVAEKMGLGSDSIASVDDVRIEDVVKRFVEMMGGSLLINGWGAGWDRCVILRFQLLLEDACYSCYCYSDSLLTRARALQKKQRSGNIAPPTPGRQSPQSSRLSVVPDFTPLTRLHPHPPALRPKLPPPLTGSPFGNIPSKRPKVHGPLLAPRYSHLLEETIPVSQDIDKPEPELQPEVDASVSSVGSEAADVTVESAVVNDDEDHPEESFDSPASVEREDPKPAEQPTPGISKRVKGFLFSYLSTLSKSTPPQKPDKLRSSQPGLPLPPPEVLGKSRGPISTPIRQPVSKPIHPKEQVHLQHAPTPKKYVFPRPVKPQRLVALHPTTTTPPGPIVPIPIQRNRRSSGGSVKDLVRSFEDLDNEVVKKLEIKRVQSIGDWNRDRRKGDSNKPVWKP
jgi:hypothetical protein